MACARAVVVALFTVIAMYVARARALRSIAWIKATNVHSRCNICGGSLGVCDFRFCSRLRGASNLLDHRRCVGGGQTGRYHHAPIFAVVRVYALVGGERSIDDSDEIRRARHTELHHRNDLDPLCLPQARGCSAPVRPAETPRAKFDASEEPRYHHPHPIKAGVFDSLQYRPPRCPSWLSIIAETVVGAHFPRPAVVARRVVSDGCEKTVEVLRGGERSSEGYEAAFLHHFLLRVAVLKSIHITPPVALCSITHDAVSIIPSPPPSSATNSQAGAIEGGTTQPRKERST
mmetsp:Transcript_13063/g.25022  ORF Transcript_13063/g.25022 Transcript_13063/m.25022 type:complete len:289 (-) Transcript_13063:139-1005(-)